MLEFGSNSKFLKEFTACIYGRNACRKPHIGKRETPKDIEGFRVDLSNY
jgi:hypothetical protein